MSVPTNNPNPQYQPQYITRPAEPSVGTTVVITLLFGIFGAIAAASATSKARSFGYTTNKYWGTFCAIFFGWIFLVVLMASAA